MHWWSITLDPWIVVPGFGQDQPQSLSYSACRCPHWNRQRVCEQLPCWNGRQIDIIGKISINDSVQFLILSDQAWGGGFPFIANLLAHVEATGWVSYNNSIQNWPGKFNDADRIMNVTWGASVDPRLDYLPQSSVNPCAAWSRVHDNFLCRRRQ